MRIQRSRFIFVALIGVACALVAGACSADSYIDEQFIGGECQADADCARIPGTSCKAAAGGLTRKCECPPDQLKCCSSLGFDSNNNPLGCKADGDYRCRPKAECEASPPVPTATATEDPPQPPPPPPECYPDTVGEDCPALAEPRCGEKTCTEGKCGTALETSIAPIEWQFPGDCKTAFCVAGSVVYQQDLNDGPIFADPCVHDTCDENGFPKRTPRLVGEPCIDVPGYCLEVETSGGPMLRCVECNPFDPSMNTCLKGLACSGYKCVPPACVDFLHNNGESDTDCGGVASGCARCPIGAMCSNDEDCADMRCEGEVGAKTCQAPTHDDGKWNDGETGNDCGCEQCSKVCEDGEGCTSAAHCASGVCYGGKCLQATCFDYVKNGGETDVDCGGPCMLPCPPTKNEGP